MFVYRGKKVDSFLLEIESPRVPALLQALNIYKLRKNVEIKMTPIGVYFSPTQQSIERCFTDPRVFQQYFYQKKILLLRFTTLDIDFWTK
jgi:folate-binding Fe-S cluster repair protein YgfZ